MKISSLLKPKDIITLASATFGILSIFLLIRGRFDVAALFLVIAAFLDYADGKVARKVGPTKYGHFLDLADLSSFGVAPALFIVLWLKPDFSLIGILIYLAAICLFLTGLLRLARFFTLGTQINYSVGLPITFNGVIFPFLWFIHANNIEIIIASFLVSALMIGTFRLSKK